MGFTRIRRYYLTSPERGFVFSMMIYPTRHLKTAKMKNLSRLSWLIVLFISGCVGIGHSPGERDADAAKGRIHGMSREVIPRLVGSWKLISFHFKDSSGQTAYPFGKDAQGRLIYEPNGRMAVQLMNPNRPRFASGDPLLTTEAEVRAAFDRYAAYYGSYSVDQSEGIILHHVEAALMPNWVGTDQVRQFEFDGKYLTLKAPLLLGGVTGWYAWSGNGCSEAQTEIHSVTLHK